MNWAWFWTTVSAIVVGGATNELGDVAPWLARRILGRAARIETTNPEEQALIRDELLALVDEVPGKFSKFFWSLGRLGYSSHFAFQRVRSRFRRIRHRVWSALSPERAKMFDIVFPAVLVYILLTRDVEPSSPLDETLGSVAGLTVTTAAVVWTTATVVRLVGSIARRLKQE